LRNEQDRNTSTAGLPTILTGHTSIGQFRGL